MSAGERTQESVVMTRRKRSRRPSHLRLLTDADVADAEPPAPQPDPGVTAELDDDMLSEADLDAVARQFFEATREKDR